MSAPYAPGTLVLSPLYSFRGYVLCELPYLNGYRVYWPSLGLEGAALHDALTPVCSPAKLAVMARWHRSRAATRKLVVHWRYLIGSRVEGHGQPIWAGLAKAWVADGNKRYPEIEHWTEAPREVSR